MQNELRRILELERDALNQEKAIDQNMDNKNLIERSKTNLYAGIKVSTHTMDFIILSGIVLLFITLFIGIFLPRFY